MNEQDAAIRRVRGLIVHLRDIGDVGTADLIEQVLVGIPTMRSQMVERIREELPVSEWSARKLADSLLGLVERNQALSLYEAATFETACAV